MIDLFSRQLWIDNTAIQIEFNAVLMIETVWREGKLSCFCSLLIAFLNRNSQHIRIGWSLNSCFYSNFTVAIHFQTTHARDLVDYSSLHLWRQQCFWKSASGQKTMTRETNGEWPKSLEPVKLKISMGDTFCWRSSAFWRKF